MNRRIQEQLDKLDAEEKLREGPSHDVGADNEAQDVGASDSVGELLGDGETYEEFTKRKAQEQVQKLVSEYDAEHEVPQPSRDEYYDNEPSAERINHEYEKYTHDITENMSDAQNSMDTTDQVPLSDNNTVLRFFN